MEKTQGLKSNIVVEGHKKSQERIGKNQREGEENGQDKKKEGTGVCGKKESWEENEGLEGKGVSKKDGEGQRGRQGRR